jgi:hypothetical protein
MIQIQASSTQNIEDQLGVALSSAPPTELHWAYQQLMLGLSLVCAGEVEDGYALVANRDHDRAEQIFKSRWSSGIMPKALKKHGYWRTAILGLLLEARKKSAVFNSMLEWVGNVDPILYSAMKCVGTQFANRDCLALWLHFDTEQIAAVACSFDGQSVYAVD